MNRGDELLKKFTTSSIDQMLTIYEELKFCTLIYMHVCDNIFILFYDPVMKLNRYVLTMITTYVNAKICGLKLLVALYHYVTME